MSARFLFYSNEMVGLGHLRRTLVIADRVSERVPDATSLILTGSMIEPFLPLPARVDTVKLPGRSRDRLGQHRATRLAIELRHLQALRSSLAQASARAFDPDVVVVDKLPLGLGGELRATLDALKVAGHAKIVLGLRDIEDRPERVRDKWGEEMREVIEHYYDEVVVYGPSTTPDAIDCMGWDDLSVPVTHVGYLGSPMPERAPAGMPRNYVLATTGGGGDGFELLARFAEAIRLEPLPYHAVMVAGPLMPSHEVQALRELVRGLDVEFHEFHTEMGALIAGARAVVSMAGYNTVSEVMRARKPALLVPRVRPSEEQLIRADELARRGLQSMLHPDALTGSRLRAALDELLERDRPPIDGYSSCGTEAAAQLLGRLAAVPEGGWRPRRLAHAA